MEKNAPALTITALQKSYGLAPAIAGVELEIAKGEIVALLGSSGCGKTTTLRCVAGLEEPNSGTVMIGGRTVFSATDNIPAEDRDVGMVFQSYALWPHMSVFENVAYKLRIKRWQAKAIEEMVMSRLQLVGMESYRDRLPGSLSGGQQQRVALARSLVGSPPLILFDEPLSNLDAKLRERMRSELRQLIKQLNLSALYVTHDQSEALSIADRVAMMQGGRICEIGTPREIFRSPKSRAVAEFLGSVNFLEPGFAVAFFGRDAVGDRTGLAVRSEDIYFFRDNPGPTAIAGKITQAEFVGSHSIYSVAVLGQTVIVHSADDYESGEEVFLRIDPAKILQVS